MFRLIALFLTIFLCVISVAAVYYNEVPILDFSAKVFVEKITETCLEVSNQPIRIIKIKWI